MIVDFPFSYIVKLGTWKTWSQILPNKIHY